MKRTALLSLSLLLAGNLLPVSAIKAEENWKEVAAVGAMTLGFASMGYLAYAGYKGLKGASEDQNEKAKKAAILGSKALGAVAATGVALRTGLGAAIAYSNFYSLSGSANAAVLYSLIAGNSFYGDLIKYSAISFASGILACKLAESAIKDYNNFKK